MTGTKHAKFTADWHSHNIPLWRRILDRYKGQPDVRALEIGSFEGRSTVWLLENILTHPTARIDCIDTFNGSPEHRQLGISVDNLLDRFLSNVEPYGDKVSCYQGQSQDILGGWGVLHDEHKYDFIYIDGSHKAADVLADAVLSFRNCKVGGLMIFDDYSWGGGGPGEFDNPKRGIDAFYHAYANQLKLVDVAHQAVYQRVVESRPEPAPTLREMVDRLTN